MAWVSWEKLCAPKACGGMGFKSLKEFNLAMLAKQGWRLQQKKNSLVYNVLKSKYFPNCEFSEATIGSNPSFTWRSIMAAQKIVKHGLRWRIGNGERVRVWGDKWLPTPSTYQVTSPRLFLHAETMVCDLIDRDHACWKTEAVDTLFLPHEAEEIKKIPLSSRIPADRQIWACSPNGVFDVRSAYWVAREMGRLSNFSSGSDEGRTRKFWSKIWKIQVPHKIRHFTWRACRDVLPTKANLVRRKVLLDDQCEECHLQAETSNHLFWTCKRAREVWECSKLVLPFTPDQSCSFKDMLWCLLVEMESSPEMIAKVVTYAWSLWGNRNEIRKGGKRKTRLELVRGAAQYLEEFYAANRVEEGVRNSSIQPVRWTPPQGQILKANVDGAVFAELKAVGIGVVIRDMEGNVKAALSKKINAPFGSVEAEAKAFEIGIQLAKDMGIKEVLIEGDSLIVQRALNELASPPPSVDAVIIGIKEVSADFHHIAFTHVGRQGNKPAHLLAKYAKSIDNILVWIEETPCVIKQALIHDVMSFQ